MLGPNQTTFVTALRSEKYEQGRGYLHSNGCYCVLGVASLHFEHDLEKDPSGIMSFGGNIFGAPRSVVDALALYTEFGDPRHDADAFSLVKLNDHCRLTFTEIADLLEENPSLYFMEPR